LVGIVSFGYLVWHGLNKVATLEPGMIALRLPSGATAYLRRQAYSGKPAEVYISHDGDFCAPYDSSHDYKLPQVIQGGVDSPVLVSFEQNTLVVHAPNQLQQPTQAGTNSVGVAFQQLTLDAYRAYVGVGNSGVALPKGWIRVEIPFEHNTCAL
jgi:hypothetical protein